ncbi:MAG: ABC transporter permease [Acidimicrobiaceae bacterium]|nr:ABC transporter permease [Acidimicrobiaceae bacterium]
MTEQLSKINAGDVYHVVDAGVIGQLRHAFSDAMAMTRRNLLRYLRIPDLLVFSTIQPVIFLVLFTYVFGGAVKGLHTSYIDFLIPGIVIQTVAFGSTQTGVGLAEDMGKGLIERFRSLPMARSAVMAGRTIADSARNLAVIFLMIAVGYLIGFRFHNGILPALFSIVLAVLFGFALSWISAFTGLAAKNVEGAQVASFIWIFPLTFASAAFVPVNTMPGWLQGFVKVNPITNAVDALRALSLGGPTARYVLYTLLWTVGLIAVFAPLAVGRYKTKT